MIHTLKSRLYTVIVSVLALFSTGALATSYIAPRLSTALQDRYTDLVVEVVDGDTFFIENRQPIRIYGINAPEPTHCYGKEAQVALSNMILGKRVRLSNLQADGYGRVLAVVHQDDTFINYEMVRRGFAVYIRAYPWYRDEIKQVGQLARDQSLGIFSADCYQPTPPNPVCTIKANFEEKSPDQKTYLRPDCAYYSASVVEKYLGEQWFCSEKEARDAGFVPSQNCK